MLYLDRNGNDVIVLSDPKEIVTEMNNQAIQQGFALDYPYYVLFADNSKSVISNVPKSIYSELKLRKYIPPKRINKNLKNLINYLLESIDLLHNADPGEQPEFSDGKGFQLNQCHHNSSSLFRLVKHLKKKRYISPKTKIKIVLGYLSHQIPYRSQTGSLGIVNNSLWVHDWHVWNYVNNLLLDMTEFSHGNILPPGADDIVTWGKAEDHVVVSPPKGVEYQGASFSDLNELDEIVGKMIGFG